MTTWLTLDEAAKHLKMGRSTIYRLAREGGIPAHKAGRVWRFDRDELDAWLKNGAMPVNEQTHQGTFIPLLAGIEKSEGEK